MRNPIVHSVAPRWLILGAVLVFASAYCSIAFTRGTERVATIWLANAILVAILFKKPTPLWPSLIVGGCLGNVGANLLTGDDPWLALGLSLCNTVEIVLVAVPLRRWAGHALDLSRLSHLGIFVLLAGAAAPAASGAIAAALLAGGNAASAWAIWASWYPADALGLLVLVPLLHTLRLDEVHGLLRPERRFETVLWFAALVAVTALVFLQTLYPLLFLPMAVLGLLTVRLGPAGTAVGIGIVALGATAATVAGLGPIMLVPGGLPTHVLVLQGFIAAVVLSKLPATAILNDRARLGAELRAANARLRLAEKIAQVGHWRMNVSTNALTWSEGVYRMHGLDPATDTPTVEAAVAAYHPDDRDEVARWVRQAVERAGEYEFGLRLVRSDGAVRDVVSRGLCETGPNGEVTAIFGTIMDVTELRQAERAIAESEARYRLIAENTTDMITHMDLSGRRLYVSPGSRGLLGYDPEELVGTNPREMIHPDDSAGLKLKFDALAGGGIEHAVNVNRLRHRDGRWIWVEASLKLIRTDDGRPAAFVGAMRDITDRMRTDEALRESEARYRLLADHSSDLIALKPTFAGPRAYVSPSSSSVVGYEPEEFAALPAKDFLHPDDLERVSAEFASLSVDNPDVTSVHRVRHKTGRWIWCDIVFRLINPGRPDQSVIVRARDITARHDAEQALAASEARYRLLADHSSDLIVLGHADGRRSYISPAVRTMLGYTVEEAHRIGMREWIHPDDRKAVFAMTLGLSSERPAGSITYRLKHKAGHYIWAEAAFKRVKDGEDVTIVTAIRDVTERVAQARQLETAKVAAEAGARIKSEFLANMSHELRTPLTGMLGVHDLLQSDPTLSERQRHFVDLAQESGRALLTIVNDILDFSKIEAGQMVIERVPFSFRELIDNCRRLGSEAIKAPDVVLVADIDPDMPDLLLGDPTRVRQVLLNLVSNAVKFTGEGTVTIRAGWTDGRLQMEVVDTGIGIAAAAIPQLFERFSQADGSTTRRFGGTGLGLSISKRLVELMGGTIGVESAPGRGSTFRFSLPLAAAERDRRRSPRIASLATCEVRARRILVAEDNAINQEIIRTVLAQKGHRLTLVEDGAAAVRAFREDVYDVVLMDVQMPGMDGLAATAAIRALERAEARAATPIVALTANAMAEEAERCRRAGMDAHVAKPIEWAQLFGTIEQVCSDRTGQADPGRTSPVTPADPRSPVLAEGTLGDLSTLLGRDQVMALLASFRRDTERRLRVLEGADATIDDLARHAHAVTALAGQLGFMELSALCAELEEQSLAGGGLDRVSALRAAADRALEAAVTSSHARAA